jgi:hypothetical protein
MRYENVRSIQLSLWPEEETKRISCPAEEFIWKAGRRVLVGKGRNKRPRVALYKKNKKQEEQVNAYRYSKCL